MTRKPKKPMHHVEMTEGKREIIRGLLEEYDIDFDLFEQLAMDPKNTLLIFTALLAAPLRI